jgi:hypothetical protein
MPWIGQVDGDPAEAALGLPDDDDRHQPGFPVPPTGDTLEALPTLVLEGSD